MKPIKRKIPETREEWLAARAEGLGGSDAGAVIGINKWKSPYTLWAEKTGQIQDEVKSTEAMRIGTDLEDYVAKRFCEQEGKKVHKSSFSYQSAEYPFMLANIDRKIVGENAGLECKTSNVFAESEYQSGSVPPQYYTQCLHYMAVMGFEKMYLAVLVLQRGLFVYEIDRSDPAVQNDIDALIEAEKNFWQCVETGTPPEVDGSESTSETLGYLHKYEDDTADLADLGSEFEMIEDIKAQIKELKDHQEEIENRIKERMNESAAAVGFSDLYKVTWKKQERTTLDSKRLKEDHPEIVAEYSKTSVSQPLKITKRRKQA